MIKMRELDSPQFRGIMILNFLCVGLLCIPRLMVSQTDPLPACALAFALALCCAFLTGRTRIKSGILMFMLFIKLLIEGGMILRIFEEFISTVLLPSSANYIIGGILILCIAIGISGGIKPSARAARLIMPLVFVVFTLCILLSSVKTDFSGLLSPTLPDTASIFETAYISAMMFFPMELAFFTRKNHAKDSIISVIAAGSLVFAASAIWQARFNYPTAFPVLDLTYSGGLSAAFMRAEEGALVCITTAAVYFTVETFVCCAAFCTGRPKGYMPVLCGIAVFILSLIPLSLENAKSVLYITAITGDGLFMLIVPVIKLLLDEYKKSISASRNTHREKLT